MMAFADSWSCVLPPRYTPATRLSDVCHDAASHSPATSRPPTSLLPSDEDMFIIRRMFAVTEMPELFRGHFITGDASASAELLIAQIER